MKRLVSVMLALIIVAGMLSVISLAGSVSQAFVYELTPDGTGIVITGMADGYGAGGYSVPDTIEGKPVKEIAAEAFKGVQLSSFSVPQTVTRIGDSAFEGCASLSGELFTSELTYIGNRAFYGCASLELNVDMNRITVGDNAFTGSGIISCILPDSLEGVSEAFFKNCVSLTNVTLPAGLRTIGAEAFSGCTALVSVQLPNGIISIGTRAFYGCKKLTGITLPGTLGVCGSNMFSRCTALKTVSVSEGVASLGRYAFSDCTALEDVILPNSVTVIDEYAFSGCGSLGVIELPGVERIYANAFKNCSNLSDVTFCAATTQIAQTAFSGCALLSTVFFGADVTNIDFDYFRTLETLSILDVDTANTVYKTDEGLILSKNRRTLYFAPHMLSGSITVPAGVTAIAPRAFENTAVHAVTLPESVKTIGEKAFFNCKMLTQATIGKSAEEIGNYAFGYVSTDSSPNLNMQFGISCYSNSEAYNYAVSNLIPVTLIASLFDANCDGTVATDDARLALRVAARLEQMNDSEKKSADIDEDGKITTGDARYILRKAARLSVVNRVTYDTVPIGNAAVLSFYKYAVDRVRIGMEASYRGKVWTKVNQMKIEGIGTSTSEDILKSFLPAASKDEATEVFVGRDAEGEYRMYPCTLDNLENVGYASCEELENGNYSVMIVLNDEFNTDAQTSSIGKLMSIPYRENISSALGNYTSASQPDCEYKSFVLSAEITKDGRFVSLKKTCHLKYDMIITVLLVDSSALCDYNLTESLYGFEYNS